MRLDALSGRGDVLQGMGRSDDALANYQRYYLESGSNKHAIRALRKIGGHQARTGDHKAALQTLSEAKTLAEALNDTEGRAGVHQATASYLGNVGRFEEALAESQKALALYEQLQDAGQVSSIMNAVGIYYAYLGVIDKSNDSFIRGLSYENMPPARRAVLLLNLGENCLELYAAEPALAYHREALSLVDSGNLTTRGDLLRNIGVALFYLGQEEEALDTIYKGLELTRQSQEPDMILQVLASVTKIEAERGNWDVALGHGEELLAEAEKLETKAHLGEAMFVLGKVAAGKNELVKAEGYWQRGIFVAHETGRRNLLWKIHAGLAEIAQSATLATAHYKIAGDIIGQILYPIGDKDLRGAFLKAEPVRKVLENAGMTHLVP
jgi:tetratricopeptide (TPR) repeat protein